MKAGSRDFIRLTPKAEIHLHLEGSIDLDTLVRIVEKRDGPVQPKARRALANLYRHRDFPEFLRNFRALCSELREPEDFALITTALCRRLQRDGVLYAEVMCSPVIFEAAGIPVDEVIDAISRSARRHREREGHPRLVFLLDGVRQWGIKGMERVVEAAQAGRGSDVIGIGMGGDERALPTAAFASVYREARRLGLHTVIHAGEFDGPRSVWEAIDELQVERVGHGVRSVEDLDLVATLVRRGIPLECCPTSNIITGVVPSWECHPIRALYRAGVRVTVNSDDPAMFGTTLVKEWEALAGRLDLSAGEVLSIGLQTGRATFLPEEEKNALLDAMRAGATRAGVVE